MSTYIKFNKAKVPKIIQSGGFPGAFFRKSTGSLMKLLILWLKMHWHHELL